MQTRRRFRALTAIGMAVFLSAGLSAQTPSQAIPRDVRPATAPIPVGTGSIAGSVVVAGTGLPARRARVNLVATSNQGGGNTSRFVMTDELGRFAFTGLLAGRYSLGASKPGHLNGAYGQAAPGRPGTAIQLADGQAFDARLQIVRGSVITGTVLDEHGDAIPGTQVRVMRYVMQGGQRTAQQAGGGATDDRGIYRVFGLQPGEYVVFATPRNTGSPDFERLRAEVELIREKLTAVARTDAEQMRELATRASMLQAQVPDTDEQATGYAPVYYPGTTAAGEAAAIAVGPGEERSGVDFQLQRVAVARVEGTVLNPTGQRLQNVQVSLVNALAAPGVANISARADNEGRFRLSNVPPGQYVLTARAAPGRAEAVRLEGPAGRGVAPAAPPDQQRLWAMLDVTVDGRNISNIAIALQPGLTVSGRIVFAGTTKPAPTDLSRLRVTASTADTTGPARQLAQNASGRVEANGRFTITGVVPGRYRIAASNPGSGWFLESSIVDGQDTLDFPVEVKGNQNVTSAVITFTDRQAELSGTLTNEHSQPAPGYTIVLYPYDQRYWTPQSRRIRTARPSTDGRFTFSNVPPGDYRLAPIVDTEPGAWYDPAFLQQLDAGALRVQILEGEKKVQNVRISTGG